MELKTARDCPTGQLVLVSAPMLVQSLDAIGEHAACPRTGEPTCPESRYLARTEQSNDRHCRSANCHRLKLATQLALIRHELPEATAPFQTIITRPVLFVLRACATGLLDSRPRSLIETMTTARKLASSRR
jgi:hypothetical protein